MTGGARIAVPVEGAFPRAVLGVRPEDCTIVAPAMGAIQGDIYATELIGDHTLVTVKAEADMLTVKAPKDFSARPGDKAGVSFSRDHLYVFDKDTGGRIR